MRDRVHLKRKHFVQKVRLPPVRDYDPALFLRCHSRDNSPNNNDVRVWRCAFEPRKDNPGESGNILATCGGNIVCFIDCVSGKVLRRYKDDDPRETFYTLAWTSQPIHTQTKDRCNILAVGGDRGVIKLLHPHQLVMHASIQAHRKYISCLLFHPSMPHLLFSGANDGWIMLWDIGTADLTRHRTDFRPLLKIDVPGSEALNMVYSPNSHTLVAACEHGCFGWNLKGDLTADVGRRMPKVLTSVSYEFTLSKTPTVVDGLELLPGDIVATKTVGSGCIHLWNLADHISKRGKRSDIKVEALVELEYTHTDVAYLNMGYANGILSVGDDLGNIYIYNLSNFLQKKRSPADEVLLPSKIIEWLNADTDPRSGIDEEKLRDKENITVNGVAVSSHSDYIAFGTDNNLVCVWRQVR